MPYITKQQREHGPTLEAVGGAANDAGTLNFLITSLCIGYVGDDPRYGSVNDAIGALECAKLELYRRLAAPYEDKKIEENGDVYK